MSNDQKGISRRDFVGLGAAAGFTLFGAETCAAPTTRTNSEIPLGIVTYNIARDWDLRTIVKNCKQLGLKAVELRTTHKHGVEPSLSQAQRKAVRKLFAESGIVLWALGTTCEFHSPDRAVVERNIEICRSFCRLARDVGARGVKVRPNGLPRGVPVKKTIRQIGESLTRCGRIGREFGVEIWCEVHGRGTAEPALMAEIMRICDHPNVGVTWNCNRQDVKNGSVKQSFNLLKSWIRSVHMHDLYDPAYPYREFFSLLKAQGYKGYCLAEIPGSSDPLRVLRYYRALFRELQR